MRLLSVLCISSLGLLIAQTPQKATSHDMGGVKPVLLTPNDVNWMPAPAATGMPSVVQLAVLSGDPFKTGLFDNRHAPAGRHAGA